MSTPFEISDRLSEDYCDLSPIAATLAGVRGRDHLWDDTSPEGHAAQARLCNAAIEDLEPHIGHPERRQAVAARVLVAAMRENLGRYQNGEHLVDLNHISSPAQVFRDVFDLMDTENDEGWDAIVTRLGTIDAPLAGYRLCLESGISSGQTVARRQVLSVIEQCRSLASDDSRFLKYLPIGDEAGRDVGAIARAVDHARAAYDEMANWLEDNYLPVAAQSDAVGRDRYLRAADFYLGMTIDPEETYRWGWEEVHRLRAEMAATAAEIDPRLTIEEVVKLLDTDPGRAAPSHQAFASFVEGIQAEAVDQLAGVHFDVPEELRKVTVNIAPGDGALGAWYHAPSEDLARPGSIWYAPGSRTAIPVWQEVSTAYHEGFPGHHLQVGTAVMLRDQVSRFHRLFLWKSGAGEGWALYAERLMDELGFFSNPEFRLGLLASQLFRATRVVVDIGAQLELTIPDHAPLHAGEIWNYEIAVDYLDQVGLQERDVAESEVKRYLGWFGQAISYKVGEREILKMREARKAKEGADFEIRRFHHDLLEAGAIRLDQVWELVV